jgi:hypothetical protein
LTTLQRSTWRECVDAGNAVGGESWDKLGFSFEGEGEADVTLAVTGLRVGRLEGGVWRTGKGVVPLQRVVYMVAASS